MYTLDELSSQTGLSHKEIKFYIQQGVISNTKTFCQKDIIMLYKLLILKALEFSYTAVYTILAIDTIEVWSVHLKKQQSLLERNKSSNQRNRIIISEMLRMIKEKNKVYWDQVFQIFKWHYNENDPNNRPKTRAYMKDFLRIYKCSSKEKEHVFPAVSYTTNSHHIRSS